MGGGGDDVRAAVVGVIQPAQVLAGQDDVLGMVIRDIRSRCAGLKLGQRDPLPRRAAARGHRGTATALALSCGSDPVMAG